MFAEPMPMQHLASPTWSNPQPGGHSTPGIIFSPKPSANTSGQLADFTNLLADIAALQQAQVSPAPPQLPPASSVGPSVSPLVKALPAVMNSPAVTPRHCLNSATATPVAYIVCDAAGFNSLAAPPITPTGATAAATTLHLLGAPTASGTDAVLLPSDHASLAAMSPGAASSLLNGRTLHPIQTKPGIPPSPSQKVHSLYKTELCRSFEETGTCRYGSKCQFAHGREELRYVQRHPKYKTEVCRTFATTGTCPYGTRCRFIHPISSSANANLSGSNVVVDDRSPTTPATPGPDTPMGEVRLRHLSVEVGNGDSGSPACHSPTASTPGSSMVSPAPGRRLPIFTKLAEEEIIGNKQVARTVSDIAHLLNEFPDVTVTDHAKVVDQTKVRRSISDMSSVRNELKSMKAEAAVFGAVEGSFGGYF